MIKLKATLVLFIVFSSLVQADESPFDKVKSTAKQWWSETKQATSDIAQSASDKASDLGDKASDLGDKASENAKETGLVFWDKMKEVGAVTQETAIKGASKIKSLLPEEGCKEDSALCFKEKE